MCVLGFQNRRVCYITGMFVASAYRTTLVEIRNMAVSPQDNPDRRVDSLRNIALRVVPMLAIFSKYD